MQLHAIFLWQRQEYMQENVHQVCTSYWRGDDVDDAWVFVCSMYGIVEKDVECFDDARHNILCKSVT